MWQLKLGGVVLGGILAFWGFNETKLNSNTSKDPQEISVSELEKGDYTGSNHIKISSHVELYYQSVYSAKIGKHETVASPSSKVDFTYIPVISKDHPFMEKLAAYIEQSEKGGRNVPEPVLSNYTVLIKTDRFKTVGAIPGSLDLPEAAVQGLIINRVTTLGAEEKKFLSEGAPGIDFDHIIILEEGRTPSSNLMAFGAMLGGVLISILALIWFFKGFSQ